MKTEQLELELIQQLCKTSKVKSLFAFGSVIRDDFYDSSDIDLVVDFDEKDPFKYTDLYFNLKSKLDVERNLEIIGEAVNRITKVDLNFQIKNAQNIIGTRNRIIHSYDNISDEVIWTIVCRELPEPKNRGR